MILPKPSRLAATAVAALLLAVTLAGPANAADRRPFARPGTPRRVERVRAFDVQHIKAELTLDPKAAALHGTVTHTLTPLHPKLAALTLDCGSKLKVARVGLVGGTGLDFEQERETLKVTLDRPYNPGETITLAIDYSGTPERGMNFVPADPARPEIQATAWTQGEAEENREWLPCYDYPNDRATSEMIVTVPKPWTVLSNGRLVDTKEAGDSSTFHWSMEVPHSSYLISIAASDFAVYRDKVGDLPVEYYVPRSVDEATARRALGATPKLIEFFGEKIGRSYPYAKYAQSTVPEFAMGGMENISATTLNDRIFRDETAAEEGDSFDLVAHELAHQWFGDLLTCRDWSHIWLNEGFASYFAALAKEATEGEDPFRIGMARSLRGFIAGDAQYRRPLVEARYENPERLFDGVAYNKGACVLHALRGLLGDEAWWAGIRRYVKDNEAKVVDTGDFRRAMEAASGRDLGWFFDQWAAKAGYAELKAKWRFEEADKTVRVRIDQVQVVDESTPLFRLPTTLELSAGSESSRSVAIVIDGASQEFIVPADRSPKMVRIDPKGWLLATVEWDKPAEEWAYQLEHCPDVLGRLDAARALGQKHDDAEAAKALAAAGPKEKSHEARGSIAARLAEVGEPGRAGLLIAAKDADARVKAAALTGLGHLKREKDAEAELRAAWGNPKASYGTRKAALRGLIGWGVPDRDELLGQAMETKSFEDTVAATALDLLAGKGGPKAREAAVVASQPGRPAPLRVEATKVLASLAKDDAELQDLLIALADDRSPQVRAASFEALSRLDLKRALPTLEGRLARGPRIEARKVEDAIAVLKRDPKAAAEPREAEALDRQAEELELRAKETRNKAEALRLKAQRARIKPAA